MWAGDLVAFDGVGDAVLAVPGVDRLVAAGLAAALEEVAVGEAGVFGWAVAGDLMGFGRAAAGLGSGEGDCGIVCEGDWGVAWRAASFRGLAWSGVGAAERWLGEPVVSMAAQAAVEAAATTAAPAAMVIQRRLPATSLRY